MDSPTARAVRPPSGSSSTTNTISAAAISRSIAFGAKNGSSLRRYALRAVHERAPGARTHHEDAPTGHLAAPPSPEGWIRRGAELQTYVASRRLGTPCGSFELRQHAGADAKALTPPRRSRRGAPCELVSLRRAHPVVLSSGGTPAIRSSGALRSRPSLERAQEAGHETAETPTEGLLAGHALHVRAAS